MQEQSPSNRSKTSALNGITVILLVVFILLLPFCVLSTGYESGPAVMGRIITEAQQTGILWVNSGSLFFAALLLFPAFLWSLVVLVRALIGYWRKSLPVKKSHMVWAAILCGVTLFLLGSSVYLFGVACVDDGSYNGNSTCGLPARPGVVVPTPFPFSH